MKSDGRQWSVPKAVWCVWLLGVQLLAAWDADFLDVPLTLESLEALRLHLWRFNVKRVSEVFEQITAVKMMCHR